MGFEQVTNGDVRFTVNSPNRSTLSVDQVPDGYRAMAAREALKVLIQP